MPAAAATAHALTPGRIALYVPNLIGYVRMAFSILSYVCAKDYPALFLVFYTTSFVLDAADGMAARALGQCSHFGAILDMLTDRASTAGLLVVLDGVIQPMPHSYTVVLATLIFLDVGSHFCRMYASLFCKKESHKDVSDSIFGLLRLYYSNRRFMGWLCIGQEFSYILLYTYHCYGGAVLWYAFLFATVPCFLKQVVNVQQLIDALYHIGCFDVEELKAKK